MITASRGFMEVRCRILTQPLVAMVSCTLTLEFNDRSSHLIRNPLGTQSLCRQCFTASCAGRWPGKTLDGARQPCLESNARNAVLPPWEERCRLIYAYGDHSIGRLCAQYPHCNQRHTQPVRAESNVSCVGLRLRPRTSCFPNLSLL